jgi:hypothetical protein
VNSGQTGQVIARLEALLARIRSRADEPRPTRTSAAHAAPPPATQAVTQTSIPAVTRTATTQAVTAAPAAPAEPPAPSVPSDHPSIVDDDELGEWPTRPPPGPLASAVAQAAGVPARAPVGSPPAVEDTGPEKAASEKAYESRERLVAAPSVPAEEPAHSPAAIDAPVASAPEVEASIEEDASLDADVIEVGEEVAIEEAPASSRRTVTQQPEERIAQIAFGAEEPAREPLHTPPPESGRLPAAPVAIDFDGDVTGVRDSAPVAPLRPDRAGPPAPEPEAPKPAAAEAAADQGAALARELAPEPTHPNLPGGDTVAEVIGEAQRFSPGTFVALLDASLAL